MLPSTKNACNFRRKKIENCSGTCEFCTSKSDANTNLTREPDDKMYKINNPSIGKYIFIQTQWRTCSDQSITITNNSNLFGQIIKQTNKRLVNKSSLNNSQKLTFLFFHGNSLHNEILESALRSVFNFSYHGILAIEIDGYGTSFFNKQANEKSLYDTGRTAINYLINDQSIDLSSIVLVGYSLGTSLCIQLALEFPNIHSIVLFSPIASLAVAANTLLGISFDFLSKYLNNKFDNASKIGYIKNPIIITHGTQDSVLDYYKNAQLLFNNAINSEYCVLFSNEEDHYPVWEEHWKFLLTLYDNEQ